MHHLSNWIEIPATDISRARRFYELVLEVELGPMDIGPVHYALFPTEDRFNAGALAQGEGYTPAVSGPTVYLDGGKDTETLLARVQKAGGKILMPKTYLSPEAGYIGLFIDTEGNRIGVQSME